MARETEQVLGIQVEPPVGTLQNESNDCMVAPATPSPKRAGGIVPRRRFQKGRLTVRAVRNPQRVGLYREDELLPDGPLPRPPPPVNLAPLRPVPKRQP